MTSIMISLSLFCFWRAEGWVSNIHSFIVLVLEGEIHFEFQTRASSAAITKNSCIYILQSATLLQANCRDRITAGTDRRIISNAAAMMEKEEQGGGGGNEGKG